MSRIFISYRREDSAGHTGRLNDRLSARFGRESVFMDIDTIQPGADFVETIKQAVGSCDVLIAIIGRRWLSNEHTESGHRLDNEKDFVRIEIATALVKKIKVIPVLVQGATMPNENELPEDLRALTRVNALEISDARWAFDTDHLLEAVQKALKLTQFAPKRRSLMKVLALVLMLGISGTGIYFGLDPMLQKLTAFRTEGKIRDARKQLGLMSIPYSADEFVSRAERGDTPAVELLLDAGMDPNAKNGAGRPALTEAVGKGRIKVVEVLLARGADASVIDDRGWMTALMGAAMMGHTEIVHKLLAKGADVNGRGHHDRTALMEALKEGYPDIAKALLAAGAEVNIQAWDGGTALMEAAGKGLTDSVEVLLAAGADVNIRTIKGNKGMTALMRASLSGGAEVVHTLLGHGANPNFQTADGSTALMAAAYSGKNDIVQMLLSKGADINAQDSGGNTALKKAVDENHTAIVETLLTAGADPNLTATGYNNRTALMTASFKGSTGIVEALLAHGADPNLKETDGSTALMSAAYSGKIAVVQALLARGADVNTMRTDGSTALTDAKKNGHQEIVALLTKAGAK